MFAPPDPRAKPQFKLLELVEGGLGGQAEVWRAWFTASPNQTFAVKLLKGGAYTQHHRLRREARILLDELNDHPNIVRVFNFVECKDPPDELYTMIPMEYLPEGTLRRDLDKRPVRSLEDTYRLLLPIAQALDYTHKAGFVHRDVKPSNIVFGADRAPRLADFGIAAYIRPEARTMELTLGGVGTSGYAAPEQFLPTEPPDSLKPRMDQYSLAVVAREMLTGVPPNHTPPRATLSPELAAVLRRATDHNAINRFESELEFLSALVQAQPSRLRPLTRQPPVRPTIAVPPPRRAAAAPLNPTAVPVSTRRDGLTRLARATLVGAVLLAVAGAALLRESATPASEPAEAIGVGRSAPPQTTLAPTTALPATRLDVQAGTAPEPPASAPTPSADAAWNDTLETLNGLWDNNLEGALSVIADYRERFPDYPDAIDKEYAAHVEYGKKLQASGDTDAALAQFLAARALMPGRHDVDPWLESLTPTPAPATVTRLAPAVPARQTGQSRPPAAVPEPEQAAPEVGASKSFTPPPRPPKPTFVPGGGTAE